MQKINSGFLICLTLVACTGSSNTFAPEINLSEFEGFALADTRNYAKVGLSGYEFKTQDAKTVSFKSCPAATSASESGIAEYDLYRYQLLINSCNALKRYLDAKSASKSFIPANFDSSLVGNLPATSVPLLNKSQEEVRTGKTIKAYYANALLTNEKNGAVKLRTEDDDIIFTFLARGDFTNDGVEDLLVRSEWFARKVGDKQVDLLLLSKTGQDQPVTINWRLLRY